MSDGSAGRGEVRRLERSLLLYVTVDSSPSGQGELQHCAFEGGRAVGEDGASFLFSGPPPAGWSFRLPVPAIGVEAAEAMERIRRLTRTWKGRARVQYLAKSSFRTVLAAATPPVVVGSRVWALLGNVVTPNGRVVPVGQSGRGSGLGELARETESGDFARMLDRIDRSGPLPAGAQPTVLAPPAAAVLVHEALGHFAEAAPEGRVNLGHRLGFRVASEIFHLLDDPRVEAGAAHYAVDDDGVPSRGATEVVREGRLLRFLHSADSARAMGLESTANGRAASVWNPPIPRMSNLLCSPGHASEDELLDRMGDGLYLHSLAYGYGFGFRLEAQIRLAEAVRGGLRTGTYFSGGVIDEDRVVLTRAEELGDTAAFNRNAMCGKEGQLLYDVGTCSPAIRMSALTVHP